MRTLVKSSKTIKITRYYWLRQQSTLTFIDSGVRSKESNTWCLHFDTSLSSNGWYHSFLLSLYLEAFTVEIIMLNNWLKLSTNDQRLYDTVITLFITTNQVLCSIPNRVYSTLIIQRGSLATKLLFHLWVYTPSVGGILPLPFMK